MSGQDELLFSASTPLDFRPGARMVFMPGAEYCDQAAGITEISNHSAVLVNGSPARSRAVVSATSDAFTTGCSDCGTATTSEP